MNNQFDRSIFVVVCHLIFVDGRLGEMITHELDFDYDRNVLVNDLKTSAIENPVKVFEFNPVEGWSRDISEDVARAWLKLILNGGIERDFTSDDMPDFITDHMGMEADAWIAEEHAEAQHEADGIRAARTY